MCNAHAHLRGGDPGERGLSETGRAGEEEVVDGLPAPPRRLDDDLQVLLELGLADELRQPAGSEAGLDGVFRVFHDGRVEELVTHDGPRAA